MVYILDFNNFTIIVIYKYNVEEMFLFKKFHTYAFRCDNISYKAHIYCSLNEILV